MTLWRRKPEVVEWLRRIEVHPGDVLALKINRELSAAATDHLRAQVAEALPEDTHAFLISHDMEITVIGWTS